MDTALYYTYSTIAQALAAAMALLSAFAMYRLNAISNERMRSAEIWKLKRAAALMCAQWQLLPTGRGFVPRSNRG